MIIYVIYLHKIITKHIRVAYFMYMIDRLIMKLLTVSVFRDSRGCSKTSAVKHSFSHSFINTLGIHSFRDG